jgi:uncharacterized Zn finger protein (UPF0148 family)
MIIDKIRYCPVCQTEMWFIDGKNYCPICRAFFYIQFESIVIDSPLLAKDAELE